MLLFDQFSNENDMLKNYNETINSHKQYPALSNYDDYLDPKFVNSINPYWLTFDPATPTIHYTLGIIHGFIMITGCFGNALVLYMFIRCKSLRTPATILVMNLAISDFCMLVKSPVVIYNSFHFGPALGDFACRMYGFLGGLTGTVTIITLTAISIDRYCVVVNPLNPLRRPIKLRLRFIVLIVWIYSFIFSIIPALNIGITKYAPEGVLTSCSMDYLDKSINARIFMFVFYIFAWAIPFFIITYCYFYILKVVYTNKVTIQSSMDRNKTEMKLAIIVISIVCLWLAAWTPYSIIALIGITGYENILSPFGAMIPAIFCKTAACIDPYVYAATHPRFRLEFKRLFFGKQKKNVRFQTSMVTPSTRRYTIGGTPPSIISSSSLLSSPAHQDIVQIDTISSIVITSSSTAVPQIPNNNNIYAVNNNHVNLDDENVDVDEDTNKDIVVTKNINNNYINTMNNINSNNNNNHNNNNLNNNNNNHNNSNNININNKKNGIIHNKLNNKTKIMNNNMGSKKKLINGIALSEMSANNLLHQGSTTVEYSNQNNNSNNNNINNNNNGINLNNINKL